MSAWRLRAGVALLAVWVAGCGQHTGRLAIHVHGEDFIEQGIPADVFADGWSVRFDRFLVSIGEVQAAEAGAGPALRDDGYHLFDLTRPSGGEGLELGAREVPAGAYDAVGYVIGPARGELVAVNADEADVALMTDGGYSLYVEGVAQKGKVEKRFRWGFRSATRYAPCKSVAEVPGGGSATAQLTIHGDHLFYDDLFSPEPDVAFDVLARADDEGEGNGDGEITEAELRAFDLGPLERYQVGSTGIDNLWDFLAFQTTTVGHIDGEGHCETEVLALE